MGFRESAWLCILHGAIRVAGHTAVGQRFTGGGHGSGDVFVAQTPAGRKDSLPGLIADIIYADRADYAQPGLHGYLRVARFPGDGRRVVFLLPAGQGKMESIKGWGAAVFSVPAHQLVGGDAVLQPAHRYTT